MSHVTVTYHFPGQISEKAVDEITELALTFSVVQSKEPSITVVQPSFTYKVQKDFDPISPRENDNISVFYCPKTRYRLTDKDAASPYEERDVLELDGGQLLTEEMLEQALSWLEQGPKETLCDEWAHRCESRHFLRDDIALITEVYLYDHSGITIRTDKAFDCQWDSGQIGWQYMTKKTLQDEYGGDKELAKKAMQCETEEFDHYLRGNVWGFTIEDEEGDTVDSCRGFIGDELEEIGMLENIGAEHQEGLRAAWENRYE